MLLKFLKNCYARDLQLFRSLKRALIYPLYRFEFYKLSEVRQKMHGFTYLDKKQMLKEGEWKWVYVIKQQKK